jgi:hypothetical protein
MSAIPLLIMEEHHGSIFYLELCCLKRMDSAQQKPFTSC